LGRVVQKEDEKVEMALSFNLDMISIEEYIQKPKEERQAHLKLSESCIERGGSINSQSIHARGLLAHIFDTTIPTNHKIYACHACNNSKCSNLYHLYWGTASENLLDAVACGRRKNTKRGVRLIG
jgi:hypothetical protein